MEKIKEAIRVFKEGNGKIQVISDFADIQSCGMLFNVLLDLAQEYVDVAGVMPEKRNDEYPIEGPIDMCLLNEAKGFNKGMEAVILAIAGGYVKKEDSAKKNVTKKNLSEYLVSRRLTIEGSIAAEVLAGNEWKEQCERTALAEIRVLEIALGSGKLDFKKEDLPSVDEMANLIYGFRCCDEHQEDVDFEDCKSLAIKLHA